MTPTPRPGFICNDHKGFQWRFTRHGFQRRIPSGDWFGVDVEEVPDLPLVSLVMASDNGWGGDAISE